MKATGLLSIQPKGIQGPVRVWTSGHNLRACTRIMTSDGQYQTIRVKVDMRPLVQAMLRWHESRHGKLSPADQATIGAFMQGENVFHRTPIVSGCGPIKVGGRYSPHVDVIGVDSCAGTVEEDDFGNRYRLVVGAAPPPPETPKEKPAYECSVVLDQFGRVMPTHRIMRHQGSPRSYLQHLTKMRRVRFGSPEVVNAFVTVGVWDPVMKRWAPLTKSPRDINNTRIGFFKAIKKAAGSAVRAVSKPLAAVNPLVAVTTPAKAILSAANDAAKNKAIKKLSRATKDVLRSDLAKAGVATLAVAFPPVGIPAAAAFATANQTLAYLDRAEAAKRDLQKLAKAGGNQAVARALPKVAPILSQGQKAANTVKAVAAAAKSGNPRAQKAMAIYRAVDGTRQHQQALTKPTNPLLANALKLSPSLPAVLKRYRLNPQGLVEFAGDPFGCACEEA